jgi:hypothetical protein
MKISELIKVFDNDVNQAKSYLDEAECLPIIDHFASEQGCRIKPNYVDLARLHFCVRKNKVFSALEFGVGFSTLVIGDAILKNKNDWEECKFERPVGMNFGLYSVDTGSYWIAETAKMLPAPIKVKTEFFESSVTTREYRGQICHNYDRLPNVVPDFIYIDGPDPAAVSGAINGISWKCSDRVVMSSDLLMIEATLLPGTTVIFDGRTLNARFIFQNLRRRWSVVSSRVSDVTVMRLEEAPLGKRNAALLQYRFDDEYHDWIDPLNETENKS